MRRWLERRRLRRHWLAHKNDAPTVLPVVDETFVTPGKLLRAMFEEVRSEGPPYVHTLTTWDEAEDGPPPPAFTITAQTGERIRVEFDPDAQPS